MRPKQSRRLAGGLRDDSLSRRADDPLRSSIVGESRSLTRGGLTRCENKTCDFPPSNPPVIDLKPVELCLKNKNQQRRGGGGGAPTCKTLSNSPLCNVNGLQRVV